MLADLPVQVPIGTWVGDVDPSSENGYRAPTRRECSAMGSGVNSPRHTADDRCPCSGEGACQLVRHTLATSSALTSVALDNGFHTIAVLVMIAAGAWALVRQVALDPAIRLVAEGVLASVLVAVCLGVWLALRQPAILSRLAQLAARIAGRQARSPAVLRDIEARFYSVFGWPRAALWAAAGWQVAFHLGAILEVWLILRALSGGTTTLAEAFVLESAGRLVIVLFKVVPFRMGVDEAGAAMVATALGIPASHGVALALVRKLRILVWNGVGLVVLARARR